MAFLRRLACPQPLLATTLSDPNPISLAPVFSSEQGIVLGPKSPGTRCPTCALEGKEVWVIPGRYCGYCGTPCDTEHLHND